MGKEVGNDVDQDQATLYMLDQYNYLNPVEKLRPVSISNGIAWTSDSKFMFYIDSPTRNIDVFDFDAEEGTIRKCVDLFKCRIYCYLSPGNCYFFCKSHEIIFTNIYIECIFKLKC